MRYWAAARAAAKRADEEFEAPTVGALLTEIRGRHDIDRVLASCSLLVDGVSVRREDSEFALPSGAVIDLLPPFAGG